MIRIVKIVERNLSDRWFDVPRGTYLNLINEDRELTAPRHREGRVGI